MAKRLGPSKYEAAVKAESIRRRTSLRFPQRTRGLTLLERFEEKISPEPMTGCWLWAGAMLPSGYGSFRVITEGSPARTHRASWELYVGAIPKGLCVLHRCDNRACVNPAHLYLGTHEQNTRDAVVRKRYRRGERAPHAKLSRDKVRAAYMALFRGATEKSLSRELKVSTHQIWCIRMGWSWADDTADLRASHPMPGDRRTKGRTTISWEAA